MNLFKYRVVSVAGHVGTVVLILGVMLLGASAYAMRHSEFYLGHEPGCTLSIQVDDAQLRVNCEPQLVDD